MHIEEIKLIGLKGAGDSSTVFTITIDGSIMSSKLP